MCISTTAVDDVVLECVVRRVLLYGFCMLKLMYKYNLWFEFVDICYFI